MQLQFLGTSASEGFPNAFCVCENCTAARQAGGRSLRKRSAALIDDELLIDMGPDLMAASLQHGVPLARVRYCLQTHEHHDHLEPSHFASRSRFCGVHDAPHLHYYASTGALAFAAAGVSRANTPQGFLDAEVSEKLNITAHPVAPFQAFEAGPYRVFSVQAAHAPEMTAMLYVIERDGRTLFYATDTADLPQATWDALEAYTGRFNVVVMDHTFGMRGRAKGHMNHEQFTEQMARLGDLGLLADDVRVYATHIGHHSHPVHEELAAFAAERGYAPAYDGLLVEV